jgi:hypothetical protein
MYIYSNFHHLCAVLKILVRPGLGFNVPKIRN